MDHNEEIIIRQYYNAKGMNEDGSVPWRLTERTVDRHGEVVIPSGVALKNFKGDPIVLFGHGWMTPMPIGRILPKTMVQTKEFIDGDVFFDEETGDEFASMVARKVRAKFLNAGSIGFKSHQRSEDPVLPKQTGVTHLKSELFEFSVVPIPALPSALARREFHEFRHDVMKYVKPEEIDKLDWFVDDYFNTSHRIIVKEQPEIDYDLIAKRATEFILEKIPQKQSETIIIDKDVNDLETNLLVKELALQIEMIAIEQARA